ncbi:hypothetical protein [Desulfosudis oleivorans]|uniref:YfhO family protein n=1 Tax=Desulfosudis oleivorans (strain DSM 6200 / JCM 39069 / Hxd3) TaxID=96561 RepID=A8ZZB7_DESOH|nr:hypothetical protein [Desulfosudis oleivorans]ABW67270.1 hypothetical protein Dole_1466 [Desulfosudis oleivorans Hxd3]
MLRLKSCILLLSASVAAWIFFYFNFIPFFPNSSGMLGNDYGLKLPQLLDGYFWFKTNGLWPVYWFSPAFCGGAPVFAHPVNHFYSVPQFLTFLMDPLAAVICTWMVFGVLGFIGFFVLMRRGFSVSVSVAVFCATLFLFNGFFASRMRIGHIDYHSFMLVPWCAVLLLMQRPAGAWGRWMLTGDTIAAGLIITYMLYSGAQSVLPAFVLTVLVVCLICLLLRPDRFSTKIFMLQYLTACFLALALSAAKLSAIFHFLNRFPRTHYALPQFDGIVDTLSAVYRALFTGSAHIFFTSRMIHQPYPLGPHEFDFGLTPVPLVVVAAAVVFRLMQGPVNERRFAFSLKRGLLFFVVCLLMAVPVFLNTYYPVWGEWLKTVPIIKNSTQCVRWFCMYIPVVILMAGIAMEKTPVSLKTRSVLAAAGAAAVILMNMTADRAYYHSQRYSPESIVDAYHAVRSGEVRPMITHIGACVDENGRVDWRINRNDTMTDHQSQMFCYDSIFGYFLETFPFRGIRPGPVLAAENGYLNIKNPACFVFPEANGCRPGDHFRVDQIEDAYAFTRYQPFPFKVSFLQRVANGITGGAVAVVFLVFGMVCWQRFRLRSRT